MVGTYYKAPSADSAPYVKIGDKVEKSTVVCIVEAMKLFNEIEAEMDGEIVEVLVENGQLVEYGQPLFLVKQTS
jgi:acetyl-CoA carboxylase biotin carboxyl carrier protein